MLNNLTQADVKTLFDYDVENGWLVWKIGQYGIPNQPAGNKPISNGYGIIEINGKKYRAHRIMWLWHKGTFPPKFIDHIDQNRMNNRIENLRLSDSRTNQHNCKTRKNNNSGFPGVHWYSRVKKYRVGIRADNETHHIGYYDTLEEAIHAAKLAKIKYHPTSPQAMEYLRELSISN